MEQEIQFCTTPDKISIAYATAGSGPPLVKVANWISHLELDWNSPVWSHLLEEFSRDHRLVRYDERGTGLSDRNVDEMSLNAFVDDLASVVEALGLERFPLLAISQGGPVAVAYAVRYPEKVSHLVIFGSFASGWKRRNLSEREIEKRQAQLALIRTGWGSQNPATRQLFTTLCIPNGSPEELESFNELQRRSASATNAARIFETIGDLDVSDLLPKLQVPVMVLHSRDDALVPFEEGRHLAAMIPQSKFVPLESQNHLLLRHERAWERFVSEVRNFIGAPPAPVLEGNTFTMRSCPVCQRLYSGEVIFCLDDGTKLIPRSQSEEESTRIFPRTI